MSNENLEKFTELYLDSPELQERLKAIPDRESFVKLMVGLGEESGYPFTAEEVEDKMLAGKERPERELVSVGEAIERDGQKDNSKGASW